MYEAIFATGALGFFIMALLGFGHGGAHGGHGGSHAGHAGHGHGPAHGGHAPAHGGAHGHVGHGHGGDIAKTTSLPAPMIHHVGFGGRAMPVLGRIGMMFISAIDIFSIAMGMGIGGLILRKFLPSGLTLVAAILCGLALDFGVVQPYLRFVMNFAAKPSEGLEGAVSQTAIAETAFDSMGKGLVKLVVEGQTVQILARLDESEMADLVLVAKGDHVVILEVDAAKNRCVVSRRMALD